MSNIVNKVKEVVTGQPSEPHTSTTGTHTGTTGTHTAGTHHTGATHTAGPHSSDMANKLDPRVDSDLDGSKTVGGAGGGYGSGMGTHGTGMGTHGTGLGTHTGHTGTTGMTGSHHTGATHTAGPHSSDMANKLDPRVDSDLDGSRTAGGAGAGGLGGAGHGTHMGSTGTSGYGTHGTHTGSTGLGSGHSTNAGPHSSNVANKLDPRVDSDMDGRGTRTMGSSTTSGTTDYGTHGTHGTHGTSGGLTGSHHTGTTHTAGPHSSDMANKLDPRVDSDRDGSKTVGGTTGTGMTGTHGTHGTHATHGTHTTGTHGTHTAGGSGPGPAPHTAGPHKSDLLNKLDPRVDSDLDGSKTLGPDKTYSGSGHAVHHTVDTHDAAQVPPSQFGKEPNHHSATMGSRQGAI